MKVLAYDRINKNKDLIMVDNENQFEVRLRTKVGNSFKVNKNKSFSKEEDAFGFFTKQAKKLSE